MTESGTDYSDYLKHVGNIVSSASLMAGFVFTSITLFLTQLQPELLFSVQMQVVLLFLGILFCIWLYVAIGFATSGILIVRRAPPLTKGSWLLTIMILVGSLGFGLVISLLFFVWNLILHALIILFLWLILFGVAAIRTTKQYMKPAKTRK